MSNTNWGPDTKTLLSVLRAQVRSKLDYCIIDYRSPKMSKFLEKLDLFHRQGLRLWQGAFKSSPKESLYVEANAPHSS